MTCRGSQVRVLLSPFFVPIFTIFTDFPARLPPPTPARSTFRLWYHSIVSPGIHQGKYIKTSCIFSNFVLLFNTVRSCFVGGFPSGQRGQTVNLLQLASVVRIHLRPFSVSRRRRQTRCRSGGTGRRTGLKILRGLPPVPVRFRSAALNIINEAAG